MSFVIYKHRLIGGRTRIETRENFDPLSFQVQKGDPVVWTIQDLDEQKIKIDIILVMTGHEIDSPRKSLRFIDTLQCDNGIVLHAFVDESTMVRL